MDAQVKKPGNNYRSLYLQSTQAHIKTCEEYEWLKATVKAQKDFVIRVDELNNNLEDTVKELTQQNEELQEELKLEKSRTNHVSEIICGLIILGILLAI